ncbi:DUF3631 domain-containing protein [Pseudomonas aeruginosa]|uniref:DUF3631 domain-containing protein n=1 Tax=Pseudomonas aeruginosa TaxID=287 RepID=UPI00071BBAD1|nr:DUF3631 domain-containing protein [Pseudomonas aeruginosa]EIU3182691.1 DUF3631 domain-containing protein [Pseudomonas aeruginosa]EIU3225960.1 DUF3631 domain-containing protein [Pseudomonas aeruginosa]EIU3239545.1 DUF3631 domain-containing protein [Pseudomonas aeruginosa]EKU7530688.1 DUF3631 domain-containing protein [Pseudomonas aeruginosa]EKV3043662.1 DUF3631 domain-containing protein [Pseudomonas aeruginosa]
MAEKDRFADQWATVDQVADALKRLEEDAGALYETAILGQLKKMRAKDPAAFARLRAQVKDTKVLSMGEFDRLTACVDDDAEPANASIFEEVEPWPEPVDGADLLDDVTHALARHVIADKETLRAAALWAAFTWLVDVVQVAPIANITAPEKRCGKSILLTALGKLANRPLQVSNIAPAALYRSIELWAPTLLIDEVDAFLAAHEDARGILNAGFTRDSAIVIRCVGDDHMPTAFNVWGAKALCGIGKIADTLADRSVPLRLRRRTAGENVESLRHSDPALWESLRSRLARFALDSAEAIGKARPSLIPGLNDRANDAWEPLLAIADQAGDHWPKSARNAAIALHGLEGESPSIGAELLADVKAVFEAKSASKVFSADLLEALVADEEAPWATWNRGKPMSPRQLSAKLADFGVKSGTVRVGVMTKKGYSLEQFRDAFDRYLSPSTPVTSVTSAQASNGAASSQSGSVTLPPSVTDKKQLKATAGAGCDDVTDKTPPARKGTGKAKATPHDETDREEF